MEPGAYAPKQRFPSRLRHTHQVSAKKTSGHLMTHSTSRQEGLGVRLQSFRMPTLDFVGGEPTRRL
jgi:hypothetical protein